MLPTWLIAVLIAVGALGGLTCLILIIRAFNKRKTKKIKIPKPEEVSQEQGEAYDEADEFEGVNFDEPEQEPVNPKVEPFNPFDFDDEFSDDDEQRYQNFMRDHEKRFAPKRQLSPDEEFEKFRREHCYSKFVTDSELAKALQNAPREVRDIILNDLLKSLDLNKYDTKI